jgi:hypothetical protein
MGIEMNRLLQEFAGLRQIHIVGCSRSGTTMAQYAMVAFANSIVADGETNPGFPYSMDVLRYFWASQGRLSGRVLFTKRNFGWFREQHIRKLSDRLKNGKLGLIMMVRDPRDVLCSRHARNGQAEAYVSEDHWLRSIEAGDKLFEAASNQTKKLTIRYEDFVQHPIDTQLRLQEAFQLSMRPGVESIADIKDNLSVYPYPLAQETVVAMHGMRNLSPSSVGRWRELGFNFRATVKDSRISDRIARYLDRYRYDQ